MASSGKPISGDGARHAGRHTSPHEVRKNRAALGADNHLLQHDLVGGVLEALLLQPAQVAHRPAGLSRVNAPVLEHEGAHLLAMHPQALDGCSAGPDEIEHGLVALVGHPHRGQLAGAQKFGQRQGVATVLLDPIAGLSWDQRRGDHDAGMAEVGDEAIQAVASRPCLVAELQVRMLSGQTLDEPAHALGRSVDLVKIPNLAAALTVGDRDGIAHLRHVDADENLATLPHGSPSYGEDRLGPSEQPSKAQCRASHIQRRGHTVLP